MSKTVENLWEAFAGESQANRKYTIFATIAEEEGHPEVAKLFRAAAESENVHLLCHLRSLGDIGGTEENLQAAMEGERYEYTEMYPGFIADAKEEGMKEARLCFTYAKNVEERHEGMYSAALESLRSGKKMEDRLYFVCRVCGNLEVNQVPSSCPVCGNPKEVFTEVR
jgi:rubrerythrin